MILYATYGRKEMKMSGILHRIHLRPEDRLFFIPPIQVSWIFSRELFKHCILKNQKHKLSLNQIKCQPLAVCFRHRALRKHPANNITRTYVHINNQPHPFASFTQLASLKVTRRDALKVAMWRLCVYERASSSSISLVKTWTCGMNKCFEADYSAPERGTYLARFLF